MDVSKYQDDIVTARAIIDGDPGITNIFFYKQCFPLFKSIFEHYFTDCTDVYEFINEIYLLIITKSKNTGHCQLENYRGESSLFTWMKSTCLFYCYRKYHKIGASNQFVYSSISKSILLDETDRFYSIEDSFITTFDLIAHSDVLKILAMMPNERYRKLIEYRYLRQYSNEETAKILGITLENYYNKHKLAKEQFKLILKKESKI